MKYARSMFVLRGLVSGLFVAMVAPAVAFYDGFEGNTPAIELTSGDFDPVGWFVADTYAEHQVQVFSTNTIGASSEWVHSGTNAVKFYSSQAKIAKNFDLRTIATLEFWAYIPAASVNTDAFRFGFSGGASTAPNITFGNGSIMYHDGSGWSNIVSSYASDEYVHVKIRADATTDTFTLEYNGTLYDNGGNGYGFYQDTDFLNQVWFTTTGNGNGKNYFVDDVTVIAYDLVPPTIVSFTPSGGNFEMVIDTEAEDVSYVKGSDDLASGSWSNVWHSTNGVDFVYGTNLNYSASDGSNTVIYVKAEDAVKFFKIDVIE